MRNLAKFPKQTRTAGLFGIDQKSDKFVKGDADRERSVTSIKIIYNIIFKHSALVIITPLLQIVPAEVFPSDTLSLGEVSWTIRCFLKDNFRTRDASYKLQLITRFEVTPESGIEKLEN